MYTPNIPLRLETPEDIRVFLEEELRSLALSMQELEIAQFRILHVEPARRVDGMVVYADGVDWNPGGGAGLYERISGAWVRLVPSNNLNEDIDDRVDALIVDGAGIQTTYNDGANTLTIASLITQYTDEMAQDTVASMIQNGTGITWSYNDGANTLTPTVTITQYTDEMAQDAVGGILTDTATINHTYDDVGNTITSDVKANSITYSLMQDVSATSRFIGRIAAGAGDPEELTGTNAKTIMGLATTTTDNALVRFDGTGGNTQNNTQTTLGDDGNLSTSPSSGITGYQVTCNAGLGLRIDGTPHAASGLIHVRPSSGSPGFITFTENAVADRWAIGVDNGNSEFRFRQANATGTIHLALTTAGELKRTGGVDIEGTNTNDAAAAGQVGELISSIVNGGSEITLTTATAANVTSISLTAGDWDVSAEAQFVATSTTNITRHQASISTVSATLNQTSGRWISRAFGNNGAGWVPGDSAWDGVTISQFRISIASTTTVYLVVEATFTVSTYKAIGALKARRVR